MEKGGPCNVGDRRANLNIGTEKFSNFLEPTEKTIEEESPWRADPVTAINNKENTYVIRNNHDRSYRF